MTRDKLHILITGAPGAGATTLGWALARQIHATFFDTDDYYWLTTSPPFQAKREQTARLSLLLNDLQGAESAVIAGSVLSWGAELEDGFSMVVFLTLNTEIRIARLRSREFELFGQINPVFLEWAAQYDEGCLPGRSLRGHEQWLRQRTCPVLRLDGDLSLAERLEKVMEALSNEQ